MEIAWRDNSLLIAFNPDRWMPQAVIDTFEIGVWSDRKVYPSENDKERIIRGEVIYSTRIEAKAAAYGMVKRAVWNEWHIPEERIQEYELYISNDR